MDNRIYIYQIMPLEIPNFTERTITCTEKKIYVQDRSYDCGDLGHTQIQILHESSEIAKSNLNFYFFTLIKNGILTILINSKWRIWWPQSEIAPI